MFVGMGISAVFPVLDGLRTFGFEQMQKQIGLSWLVLQGVLYILGAGLYAVRGVLVQSGRNQLTKLGTNSRKVVSGKSRHPWKLTSDLPCPYRFGCHVSSQRPHKCFRLSTWNRGIDLYIKPSWFLTSHILKSAFAKARVRPPSFC